MKRDKYKPRYPKKNEINKYLIMSLVKQEMIEYLSNILQKGNQDLYETRCEISIKEEIANYFCCIYFDENGWDYDNEETLYLHILYKARINGIIETLFEWYIRDDINSTPCDFEDIYSFIESYCDSELRKATNWNKEEKLFYVYLTGSLCSCIHCTADGINSLFENGIFYSTLEEMLIDFDNSNIAIPNRTFDGIKESVTDTYSGYIEIVDLRKQDNKFVLAGSEE